MEEFLEQIVTRRQNTVLYAALYGLCWLVLVALGIFSLTRFMELANTPWQETNIFTVILAVGSATLAYLIYRNKERLRLEYEYSLTSGELDVDRVLGNNRRDHLMTLRIRDVENGGLVGSDQYAIYDAMPGIKKINYALNSDQPLHYLYFVSEGRRILMKLECDAEMWEAIVSFNSNIQGD